MCGRKNYLSHRARGLLEATSCQDVSQICICAASVFMAQIKHALRRLLFQLCKALCKCFWNKVLQVMVSFFIIWHFFLLFVGYEKVEGKHRWMDRCWFWRERNHSSLFLHLWRKEGSMHRVLEKGGLVWSAVGTALSVWRDPSRRHPLLQWNQDYKHGHWMGFIRES